jgi:hypothetical protein
MWGSVLSFSEGRYFTKRPRGFRRPLTLTFGAPLPVGTHPDEARRALQELTAATVARRLDVAAATAEAFDGCCLVRREDRLLASLAPGDPLHDTLGTRGGPLLGIEATTADPALSGRDLLELLSRHRTTIWLARVAQVAVLADESAATPPLADHLAAVVMPIASTAALPAARAAAERFHATHGIEPVVAYAPAEAGGLVAMNTPPARAGGDHEVTCRSETVGRVVNGVVVWPEARNRLLLGRGSLADQGVPDDSAGTVIVGATLPRPAGSSAHAPRAILLSEPFEVDKEGFLVPRGPA